MGQKNIVHRCVTSPLFQQYLFHKVAFGIKPPGHALWLLFVCSVCFWGFKYSSFIFKIFSDFVGIGIQFSTTARCLSLKIVHMEGPVCFLRFQSARIPINKCFTFFQDPMVYHGASLMCASLTLRRRTHGQRYVPQAWLQNVYTSVESLFRAFDAIRGEVLFATSNNLLGCFPSAFCCLCRR